MFEEGEGEHGGGHEWDPDHHVGHTPAHGQHPMMFLHLGSIAARRFIEQHANDTHDTHTTHTTHTTHDTRHTHEGNLRMPTMG
jgi:hypothetical protein